MDEEGNIDLFRIPRDGGKPVQVTVGQGTDFLPSWSPDGKHIAFTRILSGESHLWVIPATGGLARQISSGGTYNAHGMWSHDSKQIAYLGIDSDQGYNTWVAEIANPEGRRLVASSPNVVIPVGWVEGGDELVIWRQMDSGVHLCSIRPDGTGERIVADQIKDRNSGMAFVFPEGNDRYSQAFYEGVPYAFAHVERAGDVFVLRVADLIRNADLVAGGAR